MESLKTFYETIDYFDLKKKEILIPLVESLESSVSGLQDLIHLLDKWILDTPEGILKNKFIEIRNSYLTRNVIVECFAEIEN